MPLPHHMCRVRSDIWGVSGDNASTVIREREEGCIPDNRFDELHNQPVPMEIDDLPENIDPIIPDTDGCSDSDHISPTDSEEERIAPDPPICIEL